MAKAAGPACILATHKLNVMNIAIMTTATTTDGRPLMPRNAPETRFSTLIRALESSRIFLLVRLAKIFVAPGYSLDLTTKPLFLSV